MVKKKEIKIKKDEIDEFYRNMFLITQHNFYEAQKAFQVLIKAIDAETLKTLLCELQNYRQKEELERLSHKSKIEGKKVKK